MGAGELLDLFGATLDVGREDKSSEVEIAGSVNDLLVPARAKRINLRMEATGPTRSSGGCP